ncbi:MAG: hypothetical protein ACP6IS_10885 [Candidatus Asgardarchaeia archaeon]
MILKMIARKAGITIGFILLGLLLLSTIQPVVASGLSSQFDNRRPKVPTSPPMYNKGLAKIVTDQITVAVTADGQVLHFMYWNTSDPSIVYHAKFVQIMEYIDQNGDGAFEYNETVPGSMFAISAVTFEFSGFENITDSNGTVIGVKFSFNSTSVNDVRQSNLELDVICYLFYVDTEMDGIQVNGLSELKFTIVIKNWNWVRDNSNLAVRFDLTWSNSTDKPKARVGDKHFDFQEDEGIEHRITNKVKEQRRIEMNYKGNVGYFDYVPDVNTDIGKKVANATYCVYADHVRMFFSYPHFNKTLVHDPIIGITSLESETTIGSFGETLSQYGISEYTLLGVIAIVLVIAVAVVKKIRK